jgi:SAM-dependent methyltransferase
MGVIRKLQQLCNSREEKNVTKNLGFRLVDPIHDQKADQIFEFDKLILRGICPVCGRKARFSGFTTNLRESGICSACGSFNRQRQMAAAVRQRLGLREAGPLSLPANFKVFNTESTGALHNMLAAQSDYVCSEYFGVEYESGKVISGVQHQDLQALSFPNASFDLILSSDVLEHMPDPYRAHREIFRVLKAGGRHIFTVPYCMNMAKDDTRARLTNGEIEYFGEKLYHGDPVRPDQGILVWTIFGVEMLVRLAEIGFEPSAWTLYSPIHGIVGNGQIIFEAKKPN